MFFKCNACKALKEENDYLKKLIDNLLQRNGVAPVTETEESVIEETEDELKDKALAEKGAVKYGEG